jgi:anti-sigma-K factor RskA/zinc ribbon protein
MQCPQCNAQLEDDTIFCGNCGKQVAPLQAKGATVSYNGETDNSEFATIISDQGSQRSALQTPVTTARNYVSPPIPPVIPSQKDTPSAPPQPPTRRTNIGLVALITALILLIIAGGTIGVVALLKNNTSPKSNTTGNSALASNATGVVSFSDSQNGSGHSNVITVSVNGLAASPAGSQYDAWIVDTQSEHSIALGTLTRNKDGTYTVKFTDGNKNLLGGGNELEITLEQGTVTLPTGQVMLSATFPPKAFVHIRHLLLSFFDTPGKIGLIVGLVDQAQKLSAASQLLQSIAGSGNTVAIECAAQSIIDIAEGTQGAHYQQLPNHCASQNITEGGDGYGLLGTNGYIANGEAHASLAATQTDTTISIRVHAGHVAICLRNMRSWITTINNDALALLNNPRDTAKVQEIVTLANHSLNGVDTNGDESIDPVAGEGGAATAYYHAQLMAALVLAPGS